MQNVGLLVALKQGVWETACTNDGEWYHWDVSHVGWGMCEVQASLSVVVRLGMWSGSALMWQYFWEATYVVIGLVSNMVGLQAVTMLACARREEVKVDL